MTKLPTADLITHPIRARILVSLMGRELTTAQIAELLPDIPRASLYRQVRRLFEGGLLEVVREVPVRGTLEKAYAVRRDAGNIPEGESSAASAEEHLRHFSSFLETMAAFYRAYLETGAADPHSEVTMVATPIYADEIEYREFKRSLQSLLRPLQENKSTRRRRILWLASIPDDKPIGTP